MNINKLLLSLVLIFSFGAAFAQDPTPTQTPVTLYNSSEDIKKAREVLKTIVNKDAPEGQKSFADVLDKGIDLFAVYATSVADMVKKIAPEVFKIMVRQQYATAIAKITYWTVLPIVFLIIPPVFKKLRHGDKSNEARILTASSDADGEQFKVLVSWASYIAFVALFIAGCYFITEAVTMLINPEYYAIKDMLEMVK